MQNNKIISFYIFKIYYLFKMCLNILKSFILLLFQLRILIRINAIKISIHLYTFTSR